MQRTPVSKSDDSQTNRTDRRRFLEGLAALGGAASLAVSAGPSQNAAPALTGISRPGSAGDLQRLVRPERAGHLGLWAA